MRRSVSAFRRKFVVRRFRDTAFRTAATTPGKTSRLCRVQCVEIAEPIRVRPEPSSKHAR